MIYDKNKCLCGECARKANESLEDRKKRALTLEWFQVYVCSSCGIYFYISYSGVVRSKESLYIHALVDEDINRQYKGKIEFYV